MSVLKLGNKIPTKYFYTSGKGQSDYGGKGLPFEAGAYDAALNKAKIEQYNIMLYTSLIPPVAREVSREKAVKDGKWGQVLDCILSKMSGTKGQRINASVLTTELYDPKGEYMGLFVCEYAGYGDESAARATLFHDVVEMVERRGWGRPRDQPKMYKQIGTSKGYSFRPHRFHGEHFKVTKRYGTALAGLCFTEYVYPLA